MSCGPVGYPENVNMKKIGFFFFFIFCAAGELIELADECKSGALQLPM